MIITQTPLRMSFVGGGSDFRSFYSQQDGVVCSTTIDKYIYVIVKERYDDRIVLAWTKKENVSSVDEIQHELIREALRKTKVEKGIEVITTADIPSEGSGLGSSSSLTVGLLHAFHLYQGEPVSAEQLAREACEIEVDILRKPIGKQDHYAAAYGGLRQYVFCKDESVQTNKIVMPKETLKTFESNLLLFYTNRTRSSSVILKEQENKSKQNFSLLETITQQAKVFKQCLENGQMDRIGELLDEQWQLKKQLAFQISDPEIDAMYDRGKQAGALGGKVLGAGGGGFMLFYCAIQSQEKLRQALKEYSAMPVQFESDGSRAIFNIKRNSWKI